MFSRLTPFKRGKLCWRKYKYR